MPAFYDDIYVGSTGALLTAIPFALPRDGRVVRFGFDDGLTCRRSIFTLIDGELRSHTNCARMQTPRVGIQRIFPGAHEAAVLVVNNAVAQLPEVTVTPSPIVAAFSDGYSAKVEMQAVLRTKISVNDPYRCAESFAKGLINSPEEAACDVLRSAVISTLRRQFPAAAARCHPQYLTAAMNDLAAVVEDEARRTLQARYSWLTVEDCTAELTVLSLDELVDRANTVIRFTEEMRRKLLDALIQTYSTPIPPEMSQVYVAYLNANPGASTDQLKAVFRDLKSLSERSSPAMVLQQFSQLGLMPAAPVIP